MSPRVTAVHWDTWPRVDDAIASYQVFRKLGADGVIPEHVRFQVGLPFPVSALNGLHADFAADYPVAAPGYADLVARESFFRPLTGLQTGDARIFLGIVLPLDGEPGLQRRQATARNSCPTSAWRCTAASASSPAARLSRRSASTATW